MPKSKQIDLENKEVPSISVKRRTVTILEFESPKVKMTIKEDKLAEALTNPEETLKIVQKRMRLKVDEPLDDGEFDGQVAEMVSRIKGYRESEL